MKHSWTLAGLAGISCLVSAAQAYALAELSVDPGSNANVSIRLEISTLLGSDNDTSTRNVSIVGTATAELGPASAPFGTIDITALDFQLANTNFDYDFYCSIFGCMLGADLAVANFNLGIAETLSAKIGPGGAVTFNNALFNPSFSFSANTSGAVSASFSGDINEVAEQTFNCTVDAAAGVVMLDQISISTIVYDIDPATLPSGVNSVRIVADVNLANVTLSGTYSESVFGDLNGDGIVNAADLGLLIAAWATDGADLNGDGTTNAADLGLLIAAWTQG